MKMVRSGANSLCATDPVLPPAGEVAPLAGQDQPFHVILRSWSWPSASIDVGEAEGTYSLVRGCPESPDRVPVGYEPFID